MKRFLSVAFAVLMIVGLSSCKKEYTCECTVGGQTTTLTAKFSKKADAETWCEDNGAGFCELK